MLVLLNMPEYMVLCTTKNMKEKLHPIPKQFLPAVVLLPINVMGVKQVRGMKNSSRSKNILIM